MDRTHCPAANKRERAASWRHSRQHTLPACAVLVHHWVAAVAALEAAPAAHEAQQRRGLLDLAAHLGKSLDSGRMG